MYHKPQPNALAALLNRLVRQIRIAWLWVRDPGMAFFFSQLRDSGIRFNETVAPPDADTDEVLYWFQERADIARKDSPFLCSVHPMPPGVDSQDREWRTSLPVEEQWSGTAGEWESEGVPAVAACIPTPHDRLWLTVFYHVPTDDDDGTPRKNDVPTQAPSLTPAPPLASTP